MTDTAMQNDAIDLRLLKSLWLEFFSLDNEGDIEKLPDSYFKQHDRYGAIQAFKNFFDNQCLCQGKHNIFSHKCILRNLQKTAHLEELNVTLDMSQMSASFRYDDFMSTLVSDPAEVMGCLNMAISLLIWEFSNAAVNFPCMPFPIYARLTKLPCQMSSFSDLKANACGRLVAIKGHVIRVSACSPLIAKGIFKCVKCSEITAKIFHDGIFAPPAQCGQPECRSKYLEFLRENVLFEDFQRVKVQEVEDEHDTIRDDDEEEGVAAGSGRAPRTFEVELRGGFLLDRCIPGDIVEVVGVLKSIQTEGGYVRRGGGGGKGGGGGGAAESGLHQLYVLANSVVIHSKLAGRGQGESFDSAGGSRKRSRAEMSTSQPETSDDGIPAAASDRVAASSFADTTSFSGHTLRVIQSIALNEHCLGILVSALCPQIFGHELVKLGLLLGLVGAPTDDDLEKNSSLQPLQPLSSSSSSSTRFVRADKRGGAGGESGNVAAEDDSGSCGSVRTRSNVHVLVVGDPGLGKSQMLRAAAKVAPRAVFVTGNTASTAGLTVSLVKETGGSGEMSIEAGALVLADRGVCCIDEFDKMASGGGGGKGYGSRGKGGGCDPHALLEAMEQQSVSVAKSGVVTSLRCRTTVLAAANPVGGHYDRRKSVSENLKLASALLSRFDLVFIMLDRPDQDRDRQISEHVMRMSTGSSRPQSQQKREAGESDVSLSLDSDVPLTLTQRLRRSVARVDDTMYSNHGGSNQPRPLSTQGSSSSQPLLSCAAIKSLLVESPEFLRQYIAYGRLYCHPTISIPAAKVLQRHYLRMRAEAHVSGDGLPVTTRHLESLIRLAQARARLELREIVQEEDACDVVDLFNECMLDAVTLDSGEIDFGRKGGMSKAKQVKALVAALRKKSVASGSNIFTQNDIRDTAILLKLKDSDNIESLVDVLRNECYLLLKGPKLYQLAS